MANITPTKGGGSINWDMIPPGSPIEAIMAKQGYTRPTVQVPNAPAKPFLTGGQIIDQGAAQQAHDTGYQNIADQLAQLALNNKYQGQAIEQSRVKGVAGTQDNAAARGVFNSSIKDAGVYDITAQAATAQQHLVDSMAAANASAKAQRTILDTALQTSQTGFNQAAVENASQIDTGYSTQPAPYLGAQPGAAPAPAGPAAPQPATPTATGGQQQSKAQSQTAGFHEGHSAGHEFFLPGVGWVSQKRFNTGV